MFLPVDAGRVVPHKPPMLMIDNLLEVMERASVSEMTVRSDMLFVAENGELDEAAYPEMISQAIAAQEGFRKIGSRNSELEGFLLGIKEMEIFAKAKVGDTLRISVYKAAKYGDFGIISGKVSRGTELLARGEIKVWQNTGESAE
jgi:predicted hotdog family 3-hydroxylacyl-ACP dehydratase